MGKLKKALCVAAAAAIACSAAGCSDISYTMTADDEEVRAGIYLDYLYSEMSNQILMMYYYQGITENYFEQTVDGKSLSDYLKDHALASTKEHVAITKKFEELGLTLTDDEIKEINDSVNSDWENMSALYETEGISKESLKDVYRCSYMRSDLFDYFYKEGGVEEVSADAMQTYVNENYLRYKIIAIDKSTAEDEDTKTAEDEEALALRDEYLAMAEGLDFYQFDEVIQAYEDYELSLLKEEAEDEDSEEEAEGEDAGEVDSADEASEADTDPDEAADDSEEADADSSEDEDPEAGGDEEDSQPEDSEGSVDPEDNEESGESSDTGSEESDEEEEDDPYANESMVNYGALDEETLEGVYGKIMTAIYDLEVGVASTYENDNAYYIIIKGDVSERTDYVEDNGDTILNYMKSDEFQSKIDEWVAAINFVTNEKAMRRYTPETIYQRQNDYYESQQ